MKNEYHMLEVNWKYMEVCAINGLAMKEINFVFELLLPVAF